MRIHARWFVLLALPPSVGACTGGNAPPPTELPVGLRCEGNTLTARVAAIPQHIAMNRLGSDVPSGMMFALEGDLVDGGGGGSQLRPDLRPRPLTLRVEAGQCLNIALRNATNEAVSLHADGVQWRTGARDDGSRVGENPDSTVSPGQSATYTLYAETEGTFLFYSMADADHREQGLFGALHVEPAGSQWYRGQLSAADLALASSPGEDGLPLVDYAAVYPTGHPLAGRPVLSMRQGQELVHGDLSALVVPASGGEAFRELTAIYHDFDDQVRQAFGQIHAPQEGPDQEARQALARLLSAYSDRYAVNYGGAGVANKVIANRLGLGPMGRCTTCRFEEFALSSWVSGDPALLVDRPVWAAGAGGGPSSAPGAEAVVLYPADPSNVLHSYLGDPVRFRVLQGSGSAVTVHHQHGHRWSRGADGALVDRARLGAGVGITVSLAGALSPGDALLHALDSAQLSRGMWAVWRTHDVLEVGSTLDPAGRPVGRALPDGEIKAGTPIPAVVPLPDRAMPPLPGAVMLDSDGQVFWEGALPKGPSGEEANPGYPFFIPGVAGSRPPQPPLDLIHDGGLPRHVVRQGRGMTAFELSWQSLTRSTPALDARALSSEGEPIEKLAMAFHASGGVASRTPTGAEATFLTSDRAPVAGAPYADPCGEADPQRVYRAAQVGHDVLLTKSGWHVPQGRVSALWEDVLPTLSHQRAPQPLYLRAHVGDCVLYEHTNLTPAERELDDFAARAPSDIVGQHAHLVGLDLTASAGVAGGFNYEDGALSPEEVRRRIQAINVTTRTGGRGGLLTPRGRVALRATAHPYFGARSTYASHGSLSSLSGTWVGAQTVIQRWHVGVGSTVGAIEELYAPGRSRSAGLLGGLLAEPPGSIWWDPMTNRRLSQLLRPGEARHPVSLRLDGGPTSWQARVEVPDAPAAGYREFALALIDDQPAYEAGLGYPAEGARTELRGAQFLTGSDAQNQAASVLRSGASCDTASDGLFPCPLDDSGGAVTINYRAEPLSHRTSGTWTDDGSAVDPTDPANALLSVARPNYTGHPAYSSLATQTPRAPSPRLSSSKATLPLLWSVLDSGRASHDPYTPLLRAYMGEPVRLAVLADLADVSVHGVRWGAGTAAQDRHLVGGAEDVRFLVPYAEEADRADHLYTLSSDGLAQGSWGLLRAHHTLQPGLDPVSVYPPMAGLRLPTCPETAPVRAFTVWATPLSSPALPTTSLSYQLVSEQLFETSRSGAPQDFGGDVDPQTGAWKGGAVRPLVLRARAGECIRVTLVNKLDTATAAALTGAGVSSQVGLRPQLIALDASDDSGFNVGQNPSQTVLPGSTIVYTWFAGSNSVDPSSGAIRSEPVAVGAVNLLPPDPVGQVPRGLVGALVIEPQDASWQILDGDRSRARVTTAQGTFDEAVLIHLDGLPSPAGCSQPHIASLNYIARPACTAAADTEPAAILPAAAGAPLRLRLLHPGVSGAVNFALHGHLWSVAEGSRRDSRMVSVGAGARSEVALQAAGGVYQIGGDYLFHAGEPAAGAWGVLRVSQPAAE